MRELGAVDIGLGDANAWFIVHVSWQCTTGQQGLCVVTLRWHVSSCCLVSFWPAWVSGAGAEEGRSVAQWQRLCCHGVAIVAASGTCP